MNTTLVSVRHGSTTLIACDANCYNATDEDCQCICNGENHGVGRVKARVNAEAHGHKWATAYIDKNSLKDVKIFVMPPPATQLSFDQFISLSPEEHTKARKK